MTAMHEQPGWTATEREDAGTKAAAPRARAGGRAAHALETARSRLMVTMAIFGLAFGAVGIKLVDATVMSQGGDTGLAQAASAHAIPASRADIVDRNGVPLARTIDSWSIGLHPRRIIGDRDALAVSLNRLMPERSVADYRRMLGSDSN